MIIGVDAGCLGIKDERLKVGVYQVAVNLFKQLKELDAHNTYYLYSFQKIDKKLLAEFGENVNNIVVKPSRGWTKIWLPLQLLKDKPDVFLGLNQSLPLKLPLQTYKSVVLVHDIIFEDYPKLYPGSFRKLHRETKTAVGMAGTIIAISEFVKKDISKTYKISEEEINVAYEGIRNFPNPKKVVQKNPYFLFVGALKPQKNIPFLIKSFAKFVFSTKTTHELLIVGGDKWMDKEIGKVLKIIPKKMQKRIKFLGNVSDAELAYLYQHTEAFISPSLSEGFGLPFLEALSFGTPVIGPNTGAIPEVVGKAGILIDPTKKDELVEAMEKILNPKIRTKLVEKASLQAQKFSWQQFAQKVLETLEA